MWPTSLISDYQRTSTPVISRWSAITLAASYRSWRIFICGWFESVNIQTSKLSVYSASSCSHRSLLRMHCRRPVLVRMRAAVCWHHCPGKAFHPVGTASQAPQPKPANVNSAFERVWKQVSFLFESSSSSSIIYTTITTDRTQANYNFSRIKTC